MVTALDGRLILVVEDEPVIAMDVVEVLKRAGARVDQARTLTDALRKVEASDLSAAVLDHRLPDGDTSSLCRRLDERHLPFVVYSGYDHIEGPCGRGEHVRKPVRPQQLVAALLDQLQKRAG